MIIQCTKCGTRFRLDSPQPGTKVRCSTCQSTFVVETPELPPMPTVAPKAVPELALDDMALDIDFDDSPKAAPEAIKPKEDELAFVDADLLGDVLDELDDAPTVTKALPSLMLGDETKVDLAPAARPELELTPAPAPKAKPLPDFESSRVVTKVGQVPNLVRITGTDLKVETPQTEVAPANSAPVDKSKPFDASAHVPDLAAELGGEDFFGGAGLSLDGTVVPAKSTEPRQTTVAKAASIAQVIESAAARPTAMLSSASPSLVTAAAPKASAFNVVAQVLMSLFLVMVLATGVLVFLGGGKIDKRLLQLDARAWHALANQRLPVAYEKARVVSMRSVLYPVSPSMSALVFFGEVENQGDKVYRDLEITAELRNSQGQVVASAKGPVGIALNPKELLGLTTNEVVRTTLRKKATEYPEQAKLGPGARVPYMAIVTMPPDGLDSLSHEILLGQGTTYIEPPPPTPEPEPEPVAELPTKKGKKFRKGKRRQ